MTSAGHPESRQRAGRTWLAVVLAIAAFAVLGALPAILPALHLSVSASPTSSAGVRLLQAPPALSSVSLPAVAKPVSPRRPAATLPGVSESREAVAVGRQDNWLRRMLHESFRLSQPRVVASPSQLPTLVLTSARPASVVAGPPALTSQRSRYTVADLVHYGALVRLPNGAALLEKNVFVAPGAHLELSSARAQAIYLDSTPHGSASIVGWGGSMGFDGTSAHPLVIKGWREATMSPATDSGNGRPYIREVAGRMTLTDVRVSFLGFWSGRTGGVAWTGLTNRPSSGGAAATTFTDNTYGSFVSRGRDMKFSADLFESNQLDGLHIHRGTVSTSARSSAAVRNGANGFHIDRATQGTVLRQDVSQHNATNGFLIDGRPLVASASASGDGVAPGSGTKIENSAALGNARTGILVEGGTGTLLDEDEVCARQSGIALRYGASRTIVDGSDVRCGPRVGVSIGPSAPGTLLSGTAVSGARIGAMVKSSGPIEMDHSRITQVAVFGITVRGASSIVTGQDNVISGTGFRAVDVRADARSPALSGGNTADWEYHNKVTVWSYLEFHPLAILWLSIIFLVTAGALWSRRRRLPPHPYPHSTRWTGRPEELRRLTPDLVGAAVGPTPQADSEPRYPMPDNRPGHDGGPGDYHWSASPAPYYRRPEDTRPQDARHPEDVAPRQAWTEIRPPDVRDPGPYRHAALPPRPEPADSTGPLPPVAGGRS